MKWIAIADRLPEISVDVLVYIGMPVAPSGEISLGFRDADKDWITVRYGSNVTHWMPLPSDPTS